MEAYGSFGPEQWAYLSKQFGICEKNANRAVPVTDLLVEEKCVAYLDEMSKAVSSPSRMTTASAFAKRYAFLTIAPALYAMTVFNKGLNMSVDNCFLGTPAQPGDAWLPHVSLSGLQTSEPSPGKRDKWRDGVIRSLFAENLAPVFRVMSKAADAPKAILWENAAVRLYSLYEKRLGQGADEQVISRIQEDFDYIIHAAPGSLFGETRNPMARFYGEPGGGAGSEPAVRIRKTCCFYYEIEADGAYCSNCPKPKSAS